MVQRVYTLIGLTATVIAMLWFWYECYFKPRKLKRERIEEQNHSNVAERHQQQQFSSRRPLANISSSSRREDRDLPPSYSIIVSSSANPPMYNTPIYSIEKDLPPSYFDAIAHQNVVKDNAKSGDERLNSRRSNSRWLHARSLLARRSNTDENSTSRSSDP